MYMQTTKQKFRDHLHSLGIQEGMDLVVHSRMLAFGRLEGGIETAYNTLRECVGPDSTIMVPAYTFQASPEIPYTPDMPGHQVGILSEYVRQLPGAVRSASPIHNHAAVGPKAHLLKQTPRTSSIGPGTDFEIQYRQAFHLLLLGCPFSRGGTYLHQVETLFGVPYRKWINLDRISTLPDGSSLHYQCRYFARVDSEWHENFDIIQPELEKRQVLRIAPAIMGRSYLVSIRDLHNAGMDVLSQDPYGLVAKG